MRQNAIEQAKAEVQQLLTDYLKEEGIEVMTVPRAPDSEPLVMFEGIEDMPLEGSLLQWEIRVILGIFGKSWQCDKLVNGVYRALVAHKPTAAELTALLTSLHVEVTHFSRARGVSKRATIRYIVGQEEKT